MIAKLNEDSSVAMGYVRAGAEAAMVGALAKDTNDKFLNHFLHFEEKFENVDVQFEKAKTSMHEHFSGVISFGHQS